MRIRAKVAMREVGIASAAMIVERRLRMNASTARAASRPPRSRGSCSSLIDRSIREDADYGRKA
jgi:hypothetical protein